MFTIKADMAMERSFHAMEFQHSVIVVIRNLAQKEPVRVVLLLYCRIAKQIFKVCTRSIYLKDRGILIFFSFFSVSVLSHCWRCDFMSYRQGIVLSYYNQKLNLLHSRFTLLGANAALNSATAVQQSADVKPFNCLFPIP